MRKEMQKENFVPNKINCINWGNSLENLKQEEEIRGRQRKEG